MSLSLKDFLNAVNKKDILFLSSLEEPMSSCSNTSEAIQSLRNKLLEIDDPKYLTIVMNSLYSVIDEQLFWRCVLSMVSRQGKLLVTLDGLRSEIKAGLSELKLLPKKVGNHKEKR